jgi:hypothetical protein
MKLLSILFFSFVIALASKAQDIDSLQQKYNPKKHTLHLVEFTNKEGTPYSIFKPQEFLSPAAIERREKMFVSIDEYDLPVNPDYIQQVLQLGVQLQNRSKWLNAIAIHTNDVKILAQIDGLPFVKSVKPLGKFRTVSEIKALKKKPKVDPTKHGQNYYGDALNQTRMLGGDALHDLGYTGAGVKVAVLDGCFVNVPSMPVFDALQEEGRLLGTKDFVEGDDYVFESSGHGTNVLSCMAAKSPYFLVGTAPDADYYLFKTEDVKAEFRAEEINWVAAVEYADSIGVEVLNSSLGYTGFNDTTMSYKYSDMDGKTAYISRGAEIGAQKGILIVNSAGNEGQGPWHYIGAPADAPSVLSIGAVRGDGKKAGFSSWGPTADGRIKPDVAAQGFSTVVSSMSKYKTTRTSGTSFSSPVMAGMVASLKQAFPNKPADEIRDIIRRSGNQSTKPDSALGHGIPNYFVAYLLGAEACIVLDHTGAMFSTFQVVDNQLSFIVEQKQPSQVSITLMNQLFKREYELTTFIEKRKITEFKIPDLEQLDGGLYILKIVVDGKTTYLPIVKK